MGAYLSEPVVDKLSNDEISGELKLSYGASCMQGWRISQEDAHNSILYYDKDTSFFSVYDGHGGHEVATYCALHLPDFLKNTQAYKDGNINQALEDVYLDFDDHLTKPEVVKQLKLIAGSSDKKEENQTDEDPDEMSNLYEEATMSIDELILRYGRAKYREAEEGIEGGGSSSKEAAERLMSKLCARANKEKQKLAKAARLNVEGKEEDKQEKESEGATIKTVASDVTEADGCGLSKSEIKSESEEKSSNASESSPNTKPVEESGERPASEEVKEEEKKESNGGLQNGSSHLHSQEAKVDEKVVISSKGKGVGKGLSNSIRKVVEKTPEELERERAEAERMAKRMERKESLRKKSGDELYRAMVTNEEEDETDEDGDDEEDEDFEGEGSSTSEEEDARGDGDEEEEDDEEGEGEEEEEAEDEEDSEQVKATTSEFSMNMKEEPGSDSGCTAVVAILRGNQLFVANAGDSRCVLSRKGRAVPLSADHKPEDDAEKTRIEGAGGVVTGDGRVNGGLNLSRAIGDHAYKMNTKLGPKQQMITALPDIQKVDLEAGDEFFVLACDGIWNSKSNQQVVDFVRPRLMAKKLTLSQICEELFDECLAPNTMGDGTGCDNMTAMIVRLDRFLPQFQEFADSAAMDETSVSTAGSAHPVKRPLNHDNSTDENGDSSSDQPSAEAEWTKEKRQRVDEDVESVAVEEVSGSKEI